VEDGKADGTATILAPVTRFRGLEEARESDRRTSPPVGPRSIPTPLPGIRS
jgi:hypothetical protein